VAVARSYLNLPDITAERFIPDLFSQEPGQRLYRSGDIARYLANGSVEFLGRADHQVKIRGYRIEIGEIEAALDLYPNIERAIVTVSGESLSEKQLIAYLVPSARQSNIDLGDLQDFLKVQLPAYMIPSAFVQLDELPLLPSGKVDRAALKYSGGSPTKMEEGFEAPRNEVERQIANICAELLKIERLSIYDNFFFLGGHSLLSAQLLSRVRRDFGVELPLRAFFESPTAAGLAELVLQKRSSQIVEATTSESGLQLVPEPGGGLDGLVSSSAQGLQASLRSESLSEEELLANLDGLSDEEVAALLKKMLSERVEIR
jgi:acyl carrier protein